MNRVSKTYLLRWLLIMTALLGPGVLQTRSQATADLFIEAAPTAGATLSPEVVRQRWVTINFDRIRSTLNQAGGTADSRTLILNLFPNVRHLAVLDRVETTSTGYVWVGRLQGPNVGNATLAVTDDVMAGSITTGGSAYAIRHVAAGVYLIQELNLQALPAEGPPVPVNSGRGDVIGIDADDGSLIDLLVVYTASARIAQGGTSAMEAYIDLGVSETNQAYASSGVVQRLRLVRKEEINYQESKDRGMSLDLSRLSGKTDGFMDSVHATRNVYGADLVQLLVNTTGSYCGIAYLMSNVSTAFESSAFGVTHYSCLSPNYTFGHEMGHNMGLRHDTFVDPGMTPFPYSHGYVNQLAFAPGAPASKRWRDIMSYNNQCTNAGFSCPRLLYFSNPATLYNGDPMGKAATANATLSLNNTRVTVANFRLSVVPAAKKKRG